MNSGTILEIPQTETIFVGMQKSCDFQLLLDTIIHSVNIVKFDI